MDHAERLADYLAGELDADERAALEAALGRDPTLRAQLEALRRADASLAGLSSPTPPDGFEARLEARLDEELDRILDGSTPTTASSAVPAPHLAATGAATPAGRGDELAERRARRQPPRWVVATSAAAAALVVVAGGGIVISQIVVSGDDAGGESTADDTMQTLESDDDAADTADDAAPESADGAAASGPLIVASDRDLDDAAVATLIDQDAPLDLADSGLSREGAAELRGSYLDVFGADAPETAADSDAAEADEEGGDDAADEAQAGPERAAGDLALDTEGDVSDDDLTDVARCLAELAEDSPEALPVYAELGTRDGEPVIALGLVTEDPETGAFTRREVWVLARDTCEPRYFAQR